MNKLKRVHNKEQYILNNLNNYNNQLKERQHLYQIKQGKIIRNTEIQYKNYQMKYKKNKH